MCPFTYSKPFSGGLRREEGLQCMNNIGPLSVRLFFFFRVHISLFISTAVHPSFCLAARLLLIVTFEEPLFFYHKGCNKLTIIKKEGLIAKGGSSTWGRTTGCTDKSIIQRKFWSKSSWINKPAFDKHVEILLLNCKVCHWCVILLLYCYGILYLLKILVCYFRRMHVVFCISWLAVCIFSLSGPGFCFGHVEIHVYNFILPQQQSNERSLYGWNTVDTA